MPASKDGIWRNPKHGTMTGYANYGCRCAECRAANAAVMRRYRKKRPEYFSKYNKEWYRKHPIAARREILRRYGITPEEYDAMLQKQSGRCAICDCEPESGKILSVDHDHQCCNGQKSCGKCVRGLLCSKCNSGISFFDEVPRRFERAMAYLREYVPEGWRRAAD